MSDFVA